MQNITDAEHNTKSIDLKWCIGYARKVYKRHNITDWGYTIYMHLKH